MELMFVKNLKFTRNDFYEMPIDEFYGIIHVATEEMRDKEGELKKEDIGRLRKRINEAKERDKKKDKK